jgi:hypothetical protein
VSQDSSYYAARAIEERRLAMASTDAKVRAIHLEMASKYEALAGANVVSIEQAVTEQQQTG